MIVQPDYLTVRPNLGPAAPNDPLRREKHSILLLKFVNPLPKSDHVLP
jgi:hypothetical protein